MPMIVKGLWSPARHFFRNLGGFVTGKPHRLRRPVPGGARRLRRTPSAACRCWCSSTTASRKCVACGLCEFACPTDCITHRPGRARGRRHRALPEAFDIDMSRCMFCGLCEEACPEEAIVMSREVEIARLRPRRRCCSTRRSCWCPSRCSSAGSSSCAASTTASTRRGDRCRRGSGRAT